MKADKKDKVREYMICKYAKDCKLTSCRHHEPHTASTSCRIEAYGYRIDMKSHCIPLSKEESKPMAKNNVVIEHLVQRTTNSVKLTDIPTGQYFYGTITADTVDRLFLKCYNSIVLVDNPERVWDHPDLLISNIRPVSVTVRVNGYLEE